MVSTRPRRPAPPVGLRDDGRRLWRDIVAAFELDPHEMVILKNACVIADTLGRLSAELSAAPSILADSTSGVHPAAREFREQALAQGRLLAQLRLPTGLAPEVKRPQRRSGARGFYSMPGGA